MPETRDTLKFRENVKRPNKPRVLVSQKSPISSSTLSKRGVLKYSNTFHVAILLIVQAVTGRRGINIVKCTFSARGNWVLLEPGPERGSIVERRRLFDILSEQSMHTCRVSIFRCLSMHMLHVTCGGLIFEDGSSGKWVSVMLSCTMRALLVPIVYRSE